MFIFLTPYISPIKKKITLSKHFGFYFDNPKSKEEKEFVHDLLKKSFDLSDIYDDFQHQRFPMKKEVPNDDVVTMESIIEKFCNLHFGKKESKKIIADLEGNLDKIINFYTKYWVIVRYDNPEMLKELSGIRKINKENRDKGIKGFVMVEDDHIFEKRSSYLISYSNIISLFSKQEDYFGWNFLITDEYRQKLPKVSIMRCLLNQMIDLISKKKEPNSPEFNFLVLIENIKPIISSIDIGLKNKTIEEEMLLYIGDTLSSKPQENKFSCLVRLVGIIEMLITHQPDFNRFNVDESITKQFILKTSIITHMAYKSRELEKIRNDLREIYSQRSNIVHGNFKEVNKFIKKLKKEERYFDDLIINCYFFVKICLNKYIEDPKFINFIKEQ